MAKITGKVIAAIKHSKLNEAQIVTALTATPTPAPALEQPIIDADLEEVKTRRRQYQRRDLVVEQS